MTRIATLEEASSMEHNVAQRIREYMIGNFLFDDPSGMPGDDESLLQSGVIDSTGVLDVVLFLEEAFEMVVADEDVVPSHFDSVSALTRYVLSKSPAAV